MIKFLSIVFRVFSFLYPYKLHRKIKSLKDLFYTLWIKNFIGCLGEHSRICYPCSLGGGGEKNITIGEYSIIRSDSLLGCHTKYNEQKFPQASISIGNNCSIGRNNHITACNKIKIGDGVLTGQFVIISDNAHGGLSENESSIEPLKRNLKSKGEVVIGNNVWLDDKVAVLAGVHIGNNVIVGANSVVTRDIPDNCIAVGTPARVINQIIK